jgi:predicted lipoprotein with Yx(FWY)xxD motif
MGALRVTLALTLVPLAVAACGGASSSTSGAVSSTSSTSAFTSAASSASTPSPTSSPALIQTGSATVAGSAKTVLVNSNGLTLYYRTTDSSTKITCTGSCAAAWPPLLLPSGTPTGSSSVTGMLTVFAGPNGNQVLYNGHPLYTWARDTAPGQATGQGTGGFLVATPDLAAA